MGIQHIENTCCYPLQTVIKSSELSESWMTYFQFSKKHKATGRQAYGKKIAIHSLQKPVHCISHFLDPGTLENSIAHSRGHKNLQSLNSCESAFLTHQQQMTDALQQQVLPLGSNVHALFVSINGRSLLQ